MQKPFLPVTLLLLLLNSCSNGAGSPDSIVNNENYPYSETLEESSDSEFKSKSLTDKTSTASEKVGNSNQLETDDLKANNVYNAKIIRDADIKFRVTDVKKASSKIANLVESNGGYISSEDLNANKKEYQTLEQAETSKTTEYIVETSNIIFIRVPSKNFQPLLSSMKGLSVTEDYVRINAKDVTEEYYDLETRLKTKKEVEARYIEILKKKAKTLEEILIAEDKIRVIREEIEAVEGRLNYLTNKVSLSSIQVEIYQDAYYTKETIRFKSYEKTGWSFGEKAGNAVSTGWNGILIFFVTLLYIWPFLAIGLGILLYFRGKRKKL
jgi:hypothetical protein